MGIAENWIKKRLKDSGDIDALLDAADLTRQLICDHDYKGIIQIQMNRIRLMI